jgi:SAM-dependent methyltransferase
MERAHLTDSSQKNGDSPAERNIAEFEQADEYFTLDGFSGTEKRIFAGISPKKYPKVLDVGCGCGRTTIELQRLGFDVTGFDVAKNLVDYGNKKYPSLKLLHLDARNIGTTFRKESFDIVLFAYNGLDYLYPENVRREVIRQIYGTLKKGGLFIYQSHNKWHAWISGKHWQSRGRNYFQETSGHRGMTLITYYANPFEQKRILKESGFSRISIRGHWPLLHFLNWFLDYACIFVAKK